MCRYFGLSSTGVTCKSSAASFGSGSYSSGGRYGSAHSSKEADASRDSYRGNIRKEPISDFRSTRQMSIGGHTSSTTEYKSRKGQGRRRRYLSNPYMLVLFIYLLNNELKIVKSTLKCSLCYVVEIKIPQHHT